MDKPEEQVDLLTGLLEQYSPTREEQPAVEYLLERMLNMGFNAGIDRVGNAVGWLGCGPQELVLLGHIDTVRGRIAVRREGDQLFGRGAVDAKGSLACFVSAAALAGSVKGWKVTVIGAVGEEGDSRGARFLTGRSAPQAVVIGEPSGWDNITLGYKGSAWVDFTYRRPVAHGASYETNACQSAVDFWNRVTERCKQLNAGKERMFEQLSPYLQHIDSHSDGFNETAQLKINFRLPVGIDHEELQALLTESTLGDESANIHFYEFDPAFRSDKNSPLVRAFLPAIRQQGGKPTFILKSGTADMNVVGPAWGCPILAYGPGDSTLDHTPDEHISIQEYMAGIRVLREALLALQTD